MSTWPAPVCIAVLVIFLLSLGFFIPFTAKHWHMLNKEGTMMLGFGAAMWCVIVWRILARLAEMHG